MGGRLHQAKHENGNTEARVSINTIKLPVQIDKTQTERCMPPPPERLPRESVPKQLTLRQVHEHRGAPTKTGQGLFHKTSHYTPNQTTTELPLHERRRLCSTEYHGSFDKVIMRKQCASNLTFLSSICLFRYNSSTDACLSIILPILAQYWHQFR